MEANGAEILANNQPLAKRGGGRQMGKGRRERERWEKKWGLDRNADGKGEKGRG